MTSTLSTSSALPRAKVFGEPQLHTDGDLLALAFAPDSSLWSVEEPGVLRHWNAETGHQLEWQALSDLETLWSFSRDARVLASASDDLTLWDATSGQVLTAIPQPSWVTALAFSPDSSLIATGHDDGAIRYWDAAGHQCLHELRQHKVPISAVAFSPDGKKLAAAGEDKVISLWEVEAGRHLGDLRGHTDRIPALAWHPSGETLVSAGWDTTARVWDVRTLSPVILLNTHSTQTTALAFSSDGKLLASADSALVVHVWDFEQKRTLHLLKGPQGEIRFVAFSPDGKKLAASGDRMIHLWNAATGQPLAGSGPRPVARTSLSVSPDGGKLASNGGGTSPRIWSVGSRQILVSLEEKQPIHGVAFSADGRWLAGAAESHIRLWDASTGQPKSALVGPEESTTVVAFSKDGQLLASGSSSGLAVWIWRVPEGEPVLLIPDALDGCTVEALAFHPEGRLLAVGGIDYMATGGSSGAISVWDLNERAEIAVFLGGVQALAFHPSGQRLASASVDQSICIWDMDTRDILGECVGHEGTVTCVAYSPDGKWLASGGEDRTLRLWNADGEEAGLIEVDSQITAVAFAPDGQALFCAHANTTCAQFLLKDVLAQ